MSRRKALILTDRCDDERCVPGRYGIAQILDLRRRPFFRVTIGDFFRLGEEPFSVCLLSFAPIPHRRTRAFLGSYDSQGKLSATTFFLRESRGVLLVFGKSCFDV